MNIINLLKRQAQVYSEMLNSMLDKAKTPADVYKAHATAFSEFYNHAFRPTLTENNVREFRMGDMDSIMDSTKTDIDVAYMELDFVSDRLREAYNTNRDYRTKVKNKVAYLGSIVSDLNIMNEQGNEQYVMYKDSLANYDFIDRDFSAGKQAGISTSEGIAHLAVASDNLVTGTQAEVRINGNGIAGNYHVAKKVNIETISGEYDIYAKYSSDEDPHDTVAAISDNQPHTWFEYEKVGFDDSLKAGMFNVEWATAQKMHDELTLKIDMKLSEVSEINWIDISPYIPERSRANITVYSIKASVDGSEYVSIYKNRSIINAEINLVPQRYLEDQLFNNDNVAKFASQGVFLFPKVRAQFVEIVLKQDKPYDESIGHTVYREVNILPTGESSTRVVPEETVPASIANGPMGKYQLDSSKIIVKSIEIIDGWRYCIGVRGIGIYSRAFETQSEFITKKFTTDRPINKVVLYTNEIIPDEYMRYGLERRNDWIRYYISINDTDWFPISPMHHNQVGALRIPPKIYEINSIVSVDEKISSINKGYLVSQTPVTSIRLKVIFSRPDDLQDSTPILEEYGLKCIFGGIA